MLKCNSKNPKFKNLTIGKDYEGLIEGDFVEVVNNTGVKARYNKKYFSEVASVAIASSVPPEITRRNLSLNDIINEMIISIGEDSDTDSFVIVLQWRDTSFGSMQIDIARNSCGVMQIDGMNNILSFARGILNRIETSNTENTAVTIDKLFDEILYNTLSRLHERKGLPIAMLTTDNPDRPEFGLFNARFFLLASSKRTIARMNPNTGNEIAVWIVDFETYL